MIPMIRGTPLDDELLPDASDFGGWDHLTKTDVIDGRASLKYDISRSLRHAAWPVLLSGELL